MVEKKTKKWINDVWNRLVENCVFFSAVLEANGISENSLYFKPNSHYLDKFMLLLSVNVISYHPMPFGKARKTFSGKYLFYDEVLFAMASTCWVGKKHDDLSFDFPSGVKIKSQQWRSQGTFRELLERDNTFHRYSSSPYIP